MVTGCRSRAAAGIGVPCKHTHVHHRQHPAPTNTPRVRAAHRTTPHTKHHTHNSRAQAAGHPHQRHARCRRVWRQHHCSRPVQRHQQPAVSRHQLGHRCSLQAHVWLPRDDHRPKQQPQQRGALGARRRAAGRCRAALPRQAVCGRDRRVLWWGGSVAGCAAASCSTARRVRARAGSRSSTCAWLAHYGLWAADEPCACCAASRCALVTACLQRQRPTTRRTGRCCLAPTGGTGSRSSTRSRPPATSPCSLAPSSPRRCTPWASRPPMMVRARAACLSVCLACRSLA
jgi:hypothetical protein